MVIGLSGTRALRRRRYQRLPTFEGCGCSPRRARRQLGGMGGIFDDAQAFIRAEVGKLQRQIGRVETALKISTGASLVAAAVALFLIASQRRR